MTERLETVWGGYSPLRRAYRRIRPGWMARLTASGGAIDRFVGEFGLTVRHGPFAGMRFPDAARGHASFLAAKLLGAYERELHPLLLEAVAGGPAAVVDIGSAEGYYVVGLAMRSGPGVEVIGFETDPGGRKVCREMAALNGVAARVRLLSRCDPQALSAVLPERAFVLCDCEGYEVDLLDPRRVPNLATSTILAELHPLVVPEVEARMRERFGTTHDIVVVNPGPRPPSDWDELADVDGQTAFRLLSEGAPSPDRAAAFRRCWAIMTPIG